MPGRLESDAPSLTGTLGRHGLPRPWSRRRAAGAAGRGFRSPRPQSPRSRGPGPRHCEAETPGGGASVCPSRPRSEASPPRRLLAGFGSGTRTPPAPCWEPAGRGERECTEPRAKRRAALSARPAPAALSRTPLQKPKHQTTEQGADEPPTSACRGLAPLYNLAAARARARSRDLPARARSPRMLCSAQPPATQRLRPPRSEGAPG